MSRRAPPPILLALLAAGQACAQAPGGAGDRYGPPPYAAAPRPYGDAPALRGAAARAESPALRTLSWAGKTDLRPAVGAPTATSPAPAAWAAPPAATGRFPGMAAYAAPAPALRTADAQLPGAPQARSATRGAAPRRPPVYARNFLRAQAPTPPPTWAPTPTLPGSQMAPAPGIAAPGVATPYAAAVAPYLVAPAAAAPLTAQPSLAASRYAVPTRDTGAEGAPRAASEGMPPPAVGQFGYVGPGRGTPTATAAIVAAPPAPTSTPSTPATALGPPRPPAYARAYVLPSAVTAPPAQTVPPSSPGAPAAVAATRPGDGGRRYSVHREYGMEPDPVPVPPQFFGATADLSTPETAPPAPRTKAALNAARLAADQP